MKMLLRQSQLSLLRRWRNEHWGFHRVKSAICGSSFDGGRISATPTARSHSHYYAPSPLQSNYVASLQSNINITVDSVFTKRQALSGCIDCANNNFRQLRQLSSSTTYDGHNSHHEDRGKGDRRRGRGGPSLVMITHKLGGLLIHQYVN